LATTTAWPRANFALDFEKFLTQILAASASAAKNVSRINEFFRKNTQCPSEIVVF